MKRKYKTHEYFIYIPHHKYKYYVYDKQEQFIDKFNTVPEICERFNLKENSIRAKFTRTKSNEINLKDIRIFREKGKFKYE